MSSPSALTFCVPNLGACVQTERFETASAHPPPRAQPGWSGLEPAPGSDVHQVCRWPRLAQEPSATVMGFPPPPYHFLTLRTLSQIHLCALCRLQGRTWCTAPEEGSFWRTLSLIVARERLQVVPMAHLLCRAQRTCALGSRRWGGTQPSVRAQPAAPSLTSNSLRFLSTCGGKGRRNRAAGLSSPVVPNVFASPGPCAHLAAPAPCGLIEGQDRSHMPGRGLYPWSVWESTRFIWFLLVLPDG